MSESEKYLKALFEDLQGRLESRLAHYEDGEDHQPTQIRDAELAADIGESSPVEKFIEASRAACKGLLELDVVVEKGPAGGSDGADREPPEGKDPEDLAELLDAIHKAKEAITGTISRAKELKLVDGLANDERFKGLAGANDLLRFTRLKNLDEAIDQVIHQRSWQSSAERVIEKIGGVSAVTAQEPRDADWDKLREAIDEQINLGVCGCSLIYCYFLDECGTSSSFERIADRVENGIVSTTEALRALHISESSEIIENISTFISSWQRGELLDVDARQKQYLAQYNFNLHAARAWGALATVDPRTSFVASFHGLLHEASRYYESQRDLQKLPDIEAARSSIGRLLDALRQGNENMRVRRTSQIRGQTEYCKRLLGGSVQGTPIALAWKEYLTGRPGITEAGGTKPWRVKVDAVASAYAWNRPPAREYEALAESGETLLVVTRIAGAAAADHPDVAKAFLSLVQPFVLRYVNAFKVVGGVDLGRSLITAPPSVIMARRIRPPAIPPLKRSWAARTPTANLTTVS